MQNDLGEQVFRAVANPVRRRILDLLAQKERTTGELGEELATLSRYAVMQHLGVLEEAGLVVSRKVGRARVNHLNAVPLTEAFERWVGSIAGRAASETLALRRFVEGMEETMTTTKAPARAVRIENELRFNAPVERVFAALTTEQDKWYPYNYGGDRLQAIRFEERVGGRVYEDWGDGRGIMYGTVTYWDPPKAVSMRGHLKGGVSTEHWFVFEQDGDGCILKQSLVCFGEISDEDAKGIESHGDLRAVEKQLRAYVEA